MFINLGRTDRFTDRRTYRKKTKQMIAKMKTSKNKTPYITRLLAILVLTVLLDFRMRAQDVDNVWASKLTGKVKGCFKALEHTDKPPINYLFKII